MLESLWAALQDQFHNEFFAGGFALGAIGVVLAAAREWPRHALRLLRRHFTTSMDVDNRTPLFRLFTKWLNEHPYSRKCSLLAATTDYDDDGTPRLLMTPGRGGHLFWYKGQPVWLYRKMDRDQSTRSEYGKMEPLETMTLRKLGRDRKLFGQMMEEAVKASSQDVDKTAIHIFSPECQDWRELDRRPSRRLSSVVLDNNLEFDLLKDIESFHNSREWYTSRGIPWRRGYLLYGPPGTGKTSLISALAGELNKDVCILNVSSQRLNDEGLYELMVDSPRNSILLLEDVDAAFLKRKGKNNSSGVTFSGLLNALDGIAAQEGRVVFMTTNHVDRLDPALIRPGRADIRLHIGFATRDQLRRLFEKFYPGENNLAECFAAALPDGKVSPCVVQEHFLKYRDDPKSASENAGTLVQEQSC